MTPQKEKQVANQQTLAYELVGGTQVNFSIDRVGPYSTEKNSDGYAVLLQTLDGPGGNVVSTQQKLFWYPQGKDNRHGTTDFIVTPGTSYSAFVFENYMLPDGTEAPPTPCSNTVTFTA